MTRAYVLAYLCADTKTTPFVKSPTSLRALRESLLSEEDQYHFHCRAQRAYKLLDDVSQTEVVRKYDSQRIESGDITLYHRATVDGKRIVTAISEIDKEASKEILYGHSLECGQRI